MGKWRKLQGKTHEEIQKEDREYIRQYMKRYRELHHDELCAKRREKYKANKLEDARKKAEYWEKRLEELENQNEEVQ